MTSDGGADGGVGGAGGAAPAGGGAAAGGAGGGAGGAPAGGAPQAYWDSFQDEGVRTSPSIQRYKTAEDLAKGYVNLEARFGVAPERRLDLPADMNDAAAMRAVWSKLGLPEKPDGYGLRLDDKATDADKASFGEFVDAMHKAGAPTSFVKAAHDWFTGASQKINAAAEQRAAERRTAGEAALKQEWGSAYDARVREIDVALQKYDPKGESGLTKENLAQFPGVARFVMGMLNRMAEPGTDGARSGEADTGGRGMTPNEAKAALRTLNADPVKMKALNDKSDPGHNTVLEERRKLLLAANPQRS